MKKTSEANPHAELAHEYLLRLLARDRHGAVQLVLDRAGAGTPVKEIYLDVLQKVQRELGELWQTNQITVAQEHYCTAATQLVMSQLYPHVFAKTRTGQRIVVACVGGELHDLGARMIADFFEMSGWDSYFLGANTPDNAVLSAIAEHEAKLLAVSATINFNVPAVASLISAVRASDDASDLRVLVGGRPFLLSDALWGAVGADGFASDAAEATVTAARLIGA